MNAIAYDVKQTHVAKTLAHGSPLLVCRFDPTGKYLFAGAQDRNLVRWEIASGTKVACPGHESWLFGIGFIDAGKTVLSTAGDGRLIWWNASDAQPKAIRTVQAHDGWGRCLAVSPDGQLIATGGNDKLVKLWAPDGKPVRTLTGHANRVYNLVFHPDGKQLISGDLVGSVRVWELATGKELAAFDSKDLHTYEASQAVDFGGIRGLSLNVDNTRLACGGLYKASNPLGNVHEPLAVVFDYATRKKLHIHTAPGLISGSLWGLRYLPDQTLVGITGGNSGGLLLFWKPDQEKDFHRFGLPHLAPHDMDFHPTEPVAATAHYDGQVRLCRMGAKV